MIRDEMWLAKAKRLPVGSTSRITLLGDKRPNTVIGHDPGHYWCYCQKRKRGARVDKTHAKYDAAVAKVSACLELPRDRVRIQDMADFERQPILEMLAQKGMDMLYLPEDTSYSASRMRLVLDENPGQVGRDVSGKSQQKWLSYDKSQFLGHAHRSDFAVVVEDPFSYYKGKYALPGVGWYCSIGTELSPALARHLSICYKRVLVMYDGDGAGRRGAVSQSRKLRGMGVRCIGRTAPEGMDPKDMTIADLRIAVSGYEQELLR